MFNFIIIMVLLQAVSGVMSFWTFLGYLLIVASAFLTIWSLYSAFSSKANKADVEKALRDKVDLTKFTDFERHTYKEFDRHDEMFVRFTARLDDDAAQREEIRELLARIDERTEYIAKNCPKNKC